VAERVLERFKEKPPATIAELLSAIQFRAGGMSRSGLAARLGLGPEIFTHWVSGRSSPSRSAMLLLEILYQYPSLVGEIESLSLGLDKDKGEVNGGYDLRSDR
jgi:DNA-binding transcriptional regulator YiaG